MRSALACRRAKRNDAPPSRIDCAGGIFDDGIERLGAGRADRYRNGAAGGRWAVWDYDLEKYFVSQMKYPKELLKKNVAGHSVVMFSIDTLGLPREINILTTIHKEFDKEIIRLTKELPHCLPCRDKNGKRIECFHTVYVPFLPQHYRDRVKADSIAKEELKQSFVEWETVSYFEKANPYAITTDAPHKKSRQTSTL